ncbi:molybdopterin molybdotransferase MoeA [Massilia sp. S19_KUP03_FR1]|uniref:molybdopterin molybdotransferase MoeA n=1 Tax=Massilia sp. S19_KUP03_FR1 TaxID=3025503 RepID=UPI002FCD7627
MQTMDGLILAGGRATRMGHVDKGLQPFRGEAMVAAVMARLAPQVKRLAISANRNLDTYAALGVPVWPDATGDFAGPLAGLEAGMRCCAAPLLLTAPCDSPFLPLDLAERLLAGLTAQDADIAIAVSADGQRQPVFCLVKTSLLPVLQAYLAGGGRKMGAWYGDANVAEVVFADSDAFRNINTLEELRVHEATSMRDVASCLASYDPEALAVRDAQQLIKRFVTPVNAVERVALRAALGRVLAADIISPIDVPAHDNSAMDGYALRGADLLPDAVTTLTVTGTAFAGRPYAGAVAPGQCIRIMTGAVMPTGCDTVAPQECVTVDGATVRLAPGVIGAGDNRRFAGEDLARGGAALARGRIVRPADLGLIASLGIAEVSVQRRLRVAFFSTGDELRSVGEALDAGCVYDSNRYTIYGMLERLGCDILDMGVVRDDPAALEAALRAACENADAIITSGGVSVGAADYTREIMARLGDVTFWKIGMRPGRPLAFGKIASNGRSAFLFGLPGNPVAVMVSFYFFARAALLQMMGAAAVVPPLLQAISSAPIRKKAGRTEYQRGIFSLNASGRTEVRLTGAQGSGMLSSMTQANCIVVLHEETGNVAAGAIVDILPFEGLV